MLWVDLRDEGLDLVVEQGRHGSQLALHAMSGAVPVMARKLGFQPVSCDRYVRTGLVITLEELRSVFPSARTLEVDASQVVREADPLRKLRQKMRSYYGPDAAVEGYVEALPNATTRLRAQAMSQLLGVEPVFMRYAGTDQRLDFAGVALRGDGDKRAYVNVDAPFPLMGVLGHEALHMMRADQPQLYADLVEQLRPLIDEQAFARYARKLDSGNRAIDGRGMAADQIREEAVADIVGDMMLDPAVWDALDDRSLIERLLEWLKEFFAAMAEQLKGRRPAVEGCIGGLDLLRDVEAARDAVADCLVNWRDAQRTPQPVGEELALAFRRIEVDAPPADSPAFAQSRIREPDGTLKVVFRGEWGPLATDPFDATLLPLPSFSASPDVASVYADMRYEPVGIRERGPSRVGAFHLDIRNPLSLGTLDEDVCDYGPLRDALTASGIVSVDEVHAVFASMDRLRHFPPEELAKPPRDRDTGMFTPGSSKLSDEDYTDTYELADSAAFIELARRAGFDGLQFLGTFTSPDLFRRPLAAAVDAGYDDNNSAAMEYRPFDRVQVRSIFDVSFEPAFAAIAFKRAWHGSPYRFERPSLDYVGEGEGAQSYGWGLYLAESRGVGEHYRNALTRRASLFRVGGQCVALRGVGEAAEREIGAGTAAVATQVADLLWHGYAPADLAQKAEHYEEPRRSHWLQVLPSLERLSAREVQERDLLVLHRAGRSALGGERSWGIQRASSTMALAIRKGVAEPEARVEALASLKAAEASLHDELRSAETAAARTPDGAAQDVVDRAQLWVRDCANSLREARAAVTLLEDSQVLFVDAVSIREEGCLYQADLDDSAPLLDWDVPVSEQPMVERLFPPADARALIGAWEHKTGDVWEGNFYAQSGALLYAALEDVHGSAKAASEVLAKIGLAGLQYRDADSRHSESAGTRNFVIWDLAAVGEFRPEIEQDSAALVL